MFGGFAYLTAFFSGKYLAARKTIQVLQSPWIYCSNKLLRMLKVSYINRMPENDILIVSCHDLVVFRWYKMVITSVSWLSGPIGILLVAFPRLLWWIESCRQKSDSTLAEEAVNSWHHRPGKRAINRHRKLKWWKIEKSWMEFDPSPKNSYIKYKRPCRLKICHYICRNIEQLDTNTI